MSEELKFEKAMEKLEKIVQDLESGEISLEDALRRYEEGVKLSRACQAKLAEAEKKIEMLTRGASGALKKVPFEPGETVESPAEGKRKKSKTNNPASESDEDLLI